VNIGGAGTTGNVVEGNYIGLNAASDAAVKNSLNGVLISGGASGNRIGTDGDGVNDSLERNVISGNASGINANVNIIGAGTNNNVVAGNYIGLNAAGTATVVNGARGVRIAVGASFNRIGADGSNDAFNADERNVISGMSGLAVFIAWGASDPNVATGNIVAGNWIGLNAAGTASLGNASEGIVISGATQNRIGTNADGVADAVEANVIVGSGVYGVDISDPGAQHNVVAGNFIGTNATGAAAMANALGGVLLEAGATNNTIGGTGNYPGLLYVGNYTNNTIQQVNAAGNVATFATGKRLYATQDLRFDSAGNLYVAENGPDAILRIDPSGNITTFADASSGLNGPNYLLFDHSGNLYVSNVGNSTILRFDPSGHVTTFATAASGLNHPDGMAFDSSGDLYVANETGAAIIRFDSVGNSTIITTPADAGNQQIGVAVDASGNLFVSNYGLSTIQRYSNGVWTLFATAANGLSGPTDLAFDASGKLWTVNYNGRTVERFDANGSGNIFASGVNVPLGVLSLAFSPSGVLYVSDVVAVERIDASGQGTVFAEESLHRPAGLAFDSAGTLYVSNDQAGPIERVDRAGHVTDFADLPGLAYPEGMAFDASGNLYVAIWGSNEVVRIDPNGQLTTVATAADGLSNPYNVAFDSSGDLFVANEGNSTIERFDLHGGVSTFADASKGLANPIGLAFDHNGNLYVANYGNNTIERFTAAGVGTVFADSTKGLSNLFGMTFDPSGNLYVSTFYAIDRFDPDGNMTVLASAAQGLVESQFLAFGPQTVASPINPAGNVISGNAGYGVLIQDAGTTGNVIEGNYIGTNAAGNAALGNAGDGVRINGANDNTIGAGDVTFLNGGYAIDLVSGGQATGSGAVTGDVRNDGALSLAGVLAIAGAYRTTANGSLAVHIGGETAGTLDQLQVSGTAALAGVFTAQVVNPFVPTQSTSVPVMTFAASTGAFASEHFAGAGAGTALRTSPTPTALLVQTMPPNADLVVTGQSVASANTGDNIIYTLTVHNNGPTGLANVNLTDLIPTGTALVSWLLQSYAAIDGWTLSVPAVGAAGTASASIAYLDSGDSATFRLTVQVAGNGDNLYAAPATTSGQSGSNIVLMGTNNTVHGALGASVQSFMGGNNVIQQNFSLASVVTVNAYLTNNGAAVRNYLNMSSTGQQAFLQQNATRQ
jgi:uncharacterized repeat protein (TIGR01451 family)